MSKIHQKRGTENRELLTVFPISCSHWESENPTSVSSKFWVGI